MTDGTGRDRRRGTPRRGSGVAHVHAVLREEILGLRLPPGSPIDEATLSERFRLSRTPIREALVRLDAGGLVTTLHNRATVVAQIDFLDLPSFFDALRLMARATARGAALQHGPAELVRIRRAQRDVVRALEAGDRAAVIAADHAFHLCIAGAARNRHFEALSLRLLDEGAA
ncbi:MULTISPECIES: GntR family transcriptional regulator [Pseudooceanicola]|uniref:GntR family transcriptional regulator n=1 Tax=Pseudooceanicola TaxID=1679449 RepID=UPI001EF0A97A|nr:MULTISPECIES: GntR family transcriptional regulator [Pseudooceanicola]